MTTFKTYRVSVEMPDGYEPVVFGVTTPLELEDEIKGRILAMRDGAIAAGYQAEVFSVSNDVEVVS